MMSRLTGILVLTGAVFFVGLAGCNKSDPGGGKGSESFTIKAPLTSTNIKQGDKQTVKLTIDRGKNFTQTTQLSATTPTKGINAEMSPATVKAGDTNEVNLSISVAEEVAPGDYKVTVTGQPEKGNSATVDVPVTVEKK
jgi:uncharacterized membrane protein